MNKFKKNIVIIGCGSVSQCFIPILFKLIDLSPKQVTIIDFVDNRECIQNFIKQGVTYVQQRITQENYASVLKNYLNSGDFCIDLAWNIDTAAMLDWCHHNNVCYLNTSVEVWSPFEDYERKNPKELTLYSRQMRLRHLIRKWSNPKGPTAIIDHGANPGLVSHMLKKGLLDLSQSILLQLPNYERHENLAKAIEERDFPSLAYFAGVKTIHISERDTQIINDPKKVNEFVNTWSVAGFIEEGLAPAELGWGTHETIVPKGALFHDEGPGNQICLSQKGVKTWARSWVPSGQILGMVVRHGEAFSISDYLTLWDGNTPFYRPTVHYVYCPCDAAISSLHELEMRHFIPQEKQRIVSNEVMSGQDELGCLIMGHPLNSWWVGSVLDIEEARRLVSGQNATTVQVAIGVAAAALYMIKHNNLGLCLPDQLDFEEILKIASPYLGQNISMPVNWTPLDHAHVYLDFNEKPVFSSNTWQFDHFLTTPKNAFR